MIQNNTDSTTSVTPSAAGAHVTDGPLTVSAAREGSSSLMVNEIDSRVVMVRPMATPVDQISRMVGARPASSMVVDYYSVDCKAPETSLSGAITKIAGGKYSDYQTYSLKVADPDMIAVTETLLVPSVLSGESGEEPLVLYVVATDKSSTTPITVICLNMKSSDQGQTSVGQLGASVVRMGCAAGELDVQTPQLRLFLSNRPIIVRYSRLRWSNRRSPSCRPKKWAGRSPIRRR